MCYNKYENRIMEKVCLLAKNYEGIKVVFYERHRLAHASKHPELRDPNFMKRVCKAIESPTFIYRDLAYEERQAIYLEEYKINSEKRYTKVVVSYLRKEKIFIVITAFRPNYVKERNKTTLLYGKDN